MARKSRKTAADSFGPPQHQLATLEPTYRRVGVLREFSQAVRAATRHLAPDIAVQHGLDLSSSFLFVRRAWPSAPEDDPYFTYAYYAKERFSFSEDEAAELLEEVVDGDKLSEGFLQYLALFPRPGDNRMVDRSRDWFEKQAAESVQMHREELHHHLLMLFSRTPIRGVIPTALLETLRAVAGGQPLPASYLELDTVPVDGQRPPCFTVTVLNGPECGNRIGPIEQASEYREARQRGFQFFLDVVDKLFRPAASTYRMIWLPVYDWSKPGASGYSAGFFIGWVFQFLPSTQQFEWNDGLAEKLSEYTGICGELLPSLSASLYTQAMRETLAQGVRDDEIATSALAKHLHLLEGWERAEIIPDWRPGEKRLWDWNPDSQELTVSLGVTDFDDKVLWGEYDEGQPAPAVCLSPRKGEFLMPSGDLAHTPLGRITARIRELYRVFSKRSDLVDYGRRVRRAELDSDRERALAHLLKSMTSSLGDLLVRAADATRSDASRQKALQLANVSTNYLSFIFLWRQFLHRGLKIEFPDTPTPISLAALLEAILLPVVALHWSNTIKCVDVAQLQAYTEAVKRQFKDEAPGMGLKDYEAFLSSQRLRTALIDSMNPEGDPTLRVVAASEIALNVPSSKAGFFAILLAFDELLLNAFKNRRNAGTYEIVVGASRRNGEDLVFIADRPPDDLPTLIPALRPVDEFLARERLGDRFGLRTIDMVFRANEMQFLVGNTEAWGFVRAVRGGFAAGCFYEEQGIVGTSCHD